MNAGRERLASDITGGRRFIGIQSTDSLVTTSDLPNIDPSQRFVFAANALAAKTFVQIVQADAQRQVKYLKTLYGVNSNKAAINAHTGNVMRAALIDQRNSQERERFARTEKNGQRWLDELDRLQDGGRDLSVLAERTSLAAQNWSNREVKHAIRDAYEFSSSLPRSERRVFRVGAGLAPQEGRARISRYARRAGEFVGILPSIEISNELADADIPSWQDSLPHLSPDQVKTAEGRYKRHLFHEFRQAAKEKYPYDKDASSNYLARLIDIYYAKEQRVDKLQLELHAEAGVNVPELWQQVDTVNHKLTEAKTKDKIYDEAIAWGPIEEKKIAKEVHAYAKRLPRQQKELAFEFIGTKRGSKLDAVKRWGTSLGLNVATDYAETALVGYTSYLAQKYIPEGLPIVLLGLAAARSYVSFARAVVENLKANWRALEEEGMSTRVTSKIAYDWFKSKIAAGIGYLAPEVVFEAFAVAKLIADRNLPEFFEFLTAANIGGTIYERGVAYATNKTLDFREARLLRRQEKADVDSLYQRGVSYVRNKAQKFMYRNQNQQDEDTALSDQIH